MWFSSRTPILIMILSISAKHPSGLFLPIRTARHIWSKLALNGTHIQVKACLVHPDATLIGDRIRHTKDQSYSGLSKYSHSKRTACLGRAGLIQLKSRSDERP